MVKPRILHLASFIGNIGDNLSHLGLHQLIESSLGIEPEPTEVEIRRTYDNYQLDDQLSLGGEFVEFCNSFDLVVFGGGNLLEPFELTGSGTRLPLELKALENLRTPSLFASVGMVPRGSVREDTLEKYSATLEYLTNHPSIAVIPRNDGSTSWLRGIEPGLADRLVESLDAAFFAPPAISALDKSQRKSIVAFNVAPDQIRNLPGVRYAHVIEKIASLIMERAITSDSEFVFVPHLHQDVKAFLDISELLPDFLVRSRFSLAKSLPGVRGANLALQEYETATEVWGMRFHSLIAGMISDKPLLPMVALDRVQFMLDSVEFAGPVVDFRLGGENSVQLASARSAVRAEIEVINRKRLATSGRYASLLPELLER